MKKIALIAALSLCGLGIINANTINNGGAKTGAVVGGL